MGEFGLDTGKTQSYARYLNNKLVMRELLKRGSCSATMLASRLSLSNAALSAIIDDLSKRDYIKQVDGVRPTGASGRRPVFWSVNERFGSIVVISLADYVAKVVVSDMKMSVTDSVETRVERYDVAMLYELALSVKNILSAEKYRGVPLLRIEFSLPGRVDMATGELQLSSQFDKDIFSEKDFIVNLFERQFGVSVALNNDINLAALGEMHYGLLKNIENGMIVHVDEGIGGALIFGGRLYSGSRGFAGELGLMHTQFGGRSGVLDEFVSMRALKTALGAATADEAVKAYETDPAKKDYVLSTARCLGESLKDAVELLDISTIVLSGGVMRFGEEYINTVNKMLGSSINGARVYPSMLGSSASVHGAISKAVEVLTDEIFR